MVLTVTIVTATDLMQLLKNALYFIINTHQANQRSIQNYCLLFRLTAVFEITGTSATASAKTALVL